ncbi:MAG: 3'-5' exonuclease, partial [Bacteroidota bacterium]
FPVVFIAGAEEGITPLQRTDSDLEEERRLFYVALTRAKTAVHITWARERKHYGQRKANKRSRFVTELPANCCVETIQDVVAEKREKQHGQLKLFG